MKRYRLFLSVVVAIFGVARAEAQLKWDQTVAQLHPAVSDETAVAHFGYENIGEKPIHIDSVETSCGCTVATLKSHDVAPGQKGEITATLNIGDRVGQQHKIITVMTNDVANPRTALTLEAMIPQVLSVQPAFVYWNVNDPLEPKVIIVTAPADSPAKKISVSSSDPKVRTELKQGDTAKEWKVTIFPPKDVDRIIFADLTIRPEYGTKNPRLFHVGVRVLPHSTS